VRPIARVATLALVVMASSSCGHSAKHDDQSPKTRPTKSATAAPHAYNIGPKALRIGQTRTGSAFTTTVTEIRNPLPPDPASFHTPEPGKKTMAWMLKTCVSPQADPAEGDLYSASEVDFSIADQAGDHYTSNVGIWVDWPTPRYPELRSLQPGECVRGWIGFEVPKSVHAKYLEYVPDGDHVADWVIPQ